MGRRAGLGSSRGEWAWRPVLLAATVALLLAGVGCGSADSSESQGLAEAHQSQEAQRQRAQRQAALRHAQAHTRREAARRHARRVRREHERRVREHREQVEEERAEAKAKKEAEANCDPNYSGACLDPTASDYDCAGGSGNGPYYTGTVTVVGEDHFGLDADGDGIGCEPY
jgi:hypothetical protein